MKQFFDDYLNLKKMIESKREYKQQMARVEALPKEYCYVFKKIQSYMWQFVLGAGYDMMELQVSLLELFEDGAEQNKPVLEITGEDVAAFVNELLKSTRTCQQDAYHRLNKEIHNKITNL